MLEIDFDPEVRDCDQYLPPFRPPFAENNHGDGLQSRKLYWYCLDYNRTAIYLRHGTCPYGLYRQIIVYVGSTVAPSILRFEA